jgi:beta-lactamase regulating signal transducer with metallopeptidase domain
MENQELVEIGEKAHSAAQRTIGVTMASIAALLAVVTLMGHRLHTEEVVVQTEATDSWAYYQAKNNRYHMYSTDAALAKLIGSQGDALAETWNKKAAEEREQADEIRKSSEHLDAETRATAHRATFFDIAEICLEVAIVLCSIALLTGTMWFWRLSFAGTAAGIAISAFGFLR